jgi:hypothetical protein
MIGIDPHKGSHTAVAIGSAEQRLGQVQVRACVSQAGQLLAWAQGWPERAWAVEGAAGLGCLLAQQVVAAGERVLDVPPKLVRQVFRFPSRGHFAAGNGTAPVEVSSGGQKVYRLSLRGNRRLNHAIHMAAVTQIRHKHSQGRAYYERKLAEAKTHKEALRSLKRRISDAIYAAADARQAAAARAKGPGGQPGNHSISRAAGSHPAHRLFGQATPGPATTIRPGATADRASNQPNRAHQRPAGRPGTSKNSRPTT